MNAAPGDLRDPSPAGAAPVLAVRDLHVRLKTREGWVYAVNGIDFSAQAGETVAVVGESGSGKSVTALSIMRLLPRSIAEVSGAIVFEDTDVLKVSEAAMRRLRGKQLSILFQDPATALNPVRRIGGQISEALTTHLGVSRSEANARSASLLGSVGIFSPTQTMRRYPHELSGGMRQRSLIAMALGLNPRLLIADEPTTALDATIQAQVLDLLKEMTRKSDTAMILITHDLAVAATVASRVLVMYGGTIVESAPTEELLRRPCHPYTLALLRSVPRLEGDVGTLQAIAGSPPDGRLPLQHCPFAPRCRWRLDVCWLEVPPLAPPTVKMATAVRAAACFNQPMDAEVAAGKPERPGFTPARPPHGARSTHAGAV